VKQFEPKDLPPDCSVRVTIEAECSLVVYWRGSVEQVLSRGESGLEMDSGEAHRFEKVTLAVSIHPDCGSDESGDGEFFGRIEVERTSEDEPDPVLYTKYLTGGIQMECVRLFFTLERIDVDLLSDVCLYKRGIRIGPHYVKIEDFEGNGDATLEESIHWFLDGERFDHHALGDYSGLFLELWRDVRYILDHTTKDIPKTIGYLLNFGSEVKYEILDIISRMPGDKRRNIICNQKVLGEALRNYLLEGLPISEIRALKFPMLSV